MAWIESHTALARHPKTLRFARGIGASVPTAIGHLHLLWWWAIEYAQDGDLSGFDADEVSAACLWEGPADILWASLQRSGFVEPDGALHDWQEYAGKLLDRRRQDAERKQRSRRGDIQEPSPPISSAVTRTSGGHPADGVRTVPNPTVPNQSPTTAVDRMAPAAPVAERTGRNGSFSAAERDAMWDAVVAECGDAVMPDAKSLRGKVVGQLLTAHYSPAQIAAAAETYRRRYALDLTDTALAKHIDRLLTTDDPVPRAPPERPSRAAALSLASTETARRIKDARERRGTGQELPALHPELRRLAP